MNREQLFESFSGLDADLLERSETYHAGCGNVTKLGAMAACIAVLAAGSWLVMDRIPQTTSDETGQMYDTADVNEYLEAPAETEQGALMSIEIPEFSIGGMGFEGLMYPDITVEDNGNPWNEDMTIETMPVYTNIGANDYGMALGLEESELMDLLNTAAAAVDMEIQELTYRRVGDGGLPPDSPLDKEQITAIQAKTDGGSITAEGNGTVTVRFDDGLALPEEYNFTYTETTDEEAEAVMAYLVDQYAALLGFDSPEIVLSGSCRYDGTYSRNYDAYDGAGDDTEDMVNYQFNYAHFAPDDDGKLMLIRLYNDSLIAEKVGDYPIITAGEAAKLLRDGHYITSVPMAYTNNEYPKLHNVAKVELVYRCGMSEGTWLPYYRFYVPLTGLNMKEGLTNYGAFYVPAVAEQYISNMPIYDGRFN